MKITKKKLISLFFSIKSFMFFLLFNQNIFKLLKLKKFYQSRLNKRSIGMNKNFIDLSFF